MKWAKAQGGVTGYAHSASGLKIDARAAAGRLLTPFDANHDALLVRSECGTALLPLSFEAIDTDNDGALTESELIAAHTPGAVVKIAMGAVRQNALLLQPGRWSGILDTRGNTRNRNRPSVSCAAFA
jgi:hypothetical protein